MVDLLDRFYQKFQSLLPVELLDRRQFLGCAQREFSRARRESGPLALLSLDIDNLTESNERHGQRIGDKAVARVVKVCSRLLKHGDLLGRSGQGDEFWIGTCLESNLALALAERIRLAVRRHPVARKAVITVSLGVADLSNDIQDLGTLLHRAEVALSKAKAQGKDRVSIWTGPER